MNQILVITKNRNTHFIKRLSEEVGDEFLVFYNPWDPIEMISGSFPVGLVRTTGVYGKDDDLEYLRSFSGHLVNPLGVMELFRRKSTQFQFYNDHQIPHLPWIKVSEHSYQAIEYWKQTNAPINLVTKPDRGQGGREIRLHSMVSFKKWYELQKLKNDFDYIIQPYLNGVNEYRFFFIEEEYFILKRSATKEFIANFQQGGVAVPGTLPSWVVVELKRLVELSGAIYGAIDLFYDESNFYVLEFNSAPGVEQIEQVLGQNLLRRLAHKLLSFL